MTQYSQNAQPKGKEQFAIKKLVDTTSFEG